MPPLPAQLQAVQPPVPAVAHKAAHPEITHEQGAWWVDRGKPGAAGATRGSPSASSFAAGKMGKNVSVD